MRLKDFFDRYSAYLYNIILFECTILLIKLNSCLPKILVYLLADPPKCRRPSWMTPYPLHVLID